MGKKGKDNSLGRALIKDRFSKNRHKKHVEGNSMLHTTEVNDGYDWGRLNLQSVTAESSLQEFLSTAELAEKEFTAEKLNVHYVKSAPSHVAPATSQPDFSETLTLPRRPQWLPGVSAEEQATKEREAFLDWRKHLNELQGLHAMMTEAAGERWEALAETHFALNGNISDENYIYCLCSRVFIRNGAKLYGAERGGSESEGEKVGGDSHVHFSQDTAYREKYEKEEVASCYCSASHTDNNYSTDEHDTNAPRIRNLQASDSGADLTYQEGHSESHNLSQSTSHTPAEELCPMIADFTEAMDEDLPIDNANVSAEYLGNYLNHDSWEKYWQVNGERLIWESWISSYSDYINPCYLDQNNSLNMNAQGIPKEHSADQINSLVDSELGECSKVPMRERKFSYDSKVNPYKKEGNLACKATNSSELMCTVDADWAPVARQRSCSEHDRLLSPRTLATSDSMTNVTKITMSSCDMNSSHVTSESSRSDDYSVSSSSSADQSNDQTRVYVDDCDNTTLQSEEMDTDQYWQFLWKKHFGEQYALHYANYIENHAAQVNSYIPTINVEMVVKNDELETAVDPREKADIECENSDGNSQELPSVVEVQRQVTNIKLDEEKPRKKKKKSTSYLSSVGVLLQSLLNEEAGQNREPVDGGEAQGSKDGSAPDEVDAPSTMIVQDIYTSSSNVSPNRFNDGDGDDEPPEKKPIELKRSHESDSEEIAAEKIRSTFTQIGLSWESMNAPKGQLVYRKKMYQLRPPRPKKLNIARKTYFDDEGRPYTLDKSSNECNDDIKEMQTDDDCSQVKSDDELTKEPPDADTQIESDASYVTAGTSVLERIDSDTGLSDYVEACGSDIVKRKRRKHRKSAPSIATLQLPSEIADDPKMLKYWNKRHSLFHRFDEGIKLDKECWFSVTPEKVAKHLAERCRCDLIVDAFCGAGGNAIQFAWTCERVIAIDIDPVKVALARHNAAVYGLADRIEFIVGDFFELAPNLKGDVVFLSPPWGGPQYSEVKHYDLETMLEPKPSSALMAAALHISSNVALYVPRSTRSEQLIELAKWSGAVEIEQNFLGRRLVALTAYYGDLVNY